MSKPILLGYRRKSVVQTKSDLVSPEQQTHSCEQWAQLHLPGAAVEWHEDVEGHRSGRQEKGRPGWQALLGQLDRDDVAGVIVYSLDRAYRNVQQFLTFLARLEALDKRLITVKESLDTRTAMGRAVVTILMTIAQLESDQTSERMRTGIKYRREVQGRHWGRPPFGCQRNSQGQLVPSAETYWLNPVTGEARAERPAAGAWEERRYYDALVALYRQYATGEHSLWTLALALNDQGWRFRDMKHQPVSFDNGDVSRMVGNWRLFRGELPMGPGERVSRRGLVLPGGHEPILPVELCETVGRIWNERAMIHTSSRAAKKDYILSPVLYCAICGQSMKGAVSDDGSRRYRHSFVKQGCPQPRLPADLVERWVFDKLAGLIGSGLIDDIRTEAHRLAQEAAATDAGRARLAELERQRERLARLEALYLDGEIDRSRYSAHRAEISTTMARLESELYALNGAAAFVEFADRLIASLGRLHEASQASQAALIYSMFERIEISSAGARFVGRAWLKGLLS